MTRCIIHTSLNKWYVIISDNRPQITRRQKWKTKLGMMCFDRSWPWPMMVNCMQVGLKYSLKLHFNFIFLWFHEMSFDFSTNPRTENVANTLWWGGIPKLCCHVFGLFWPPTPLRWHFLPYKRWQKQDIFGLPTHLLL